MWEAIKEYYTTIENKYYVDPVIFLGIHVVATPLIYIRLSMACKKI